MVWNQQLKPNMQNTEAMSLDKPHELLQFVSGSVCLATLLIHFWSYWISVEHFWDL